MLHEYCQNYLLIPRTLPFPDVLKCQDIWNPYRHSVYASPPPPQSAVGSHRECKSQSRFRSRDCPWLIPMIIWQVSSLGHWFIDSKTRFENLEDFNTEFAPAVYPAFSRYCVLKINIRATNSWQAWRNLWISCGPMNFRNNSSSGARSGIPGLYVTSAKSMEYDRGSGAPSEMSGLSVAFSQVNGIW